MKVGHKAVDELPLMAWHDERFGITRESNRVVVLPRVSERFEGSRYRCPDCDDPISPAATCRNCLCSGDWHFAPFFVNEMVGDSFCSDRPKRIQPHMKRNLGPRKASLLQVTDEIGREV